MNEPKILPDETDKNVSGQTSHRGWLPVWLGVGAVAGIVFGVVIRAVVLFTILNASPQAGDATRGAGRGGAEGFGPLQVVDSVSYARTAESLLRLGAFRESVTNPAQAEIMRTPGYPLVIAAHRAVFGERDWPIAVTQILFFVLTAVVSCWVAARLAAGLWGGGVRRGHPARVEVMEGSSESAEESTRAGCPRHVKAVCAGVAWWLAMNPESVLASTLLMTEATFTLLLVASVALLIRATEAARAGCGLAKCAAWCGGGGMVLASATFVRPVTVYSVAPVALGLTFAMIAALRSRDGLPWRGDKLDGRAWRRILRASVCLITFAFAAQLPIAAWSVRNFRETREAAFSLISNISLLEWRGADVRARRDGISFEEARTRLLREADVDQEARGLAKLSQQERGRRALNTALPVLRDSPGLVLKSSAASLPRMLISPGESDVLVAMRLPVSETSPLRDARSVGVGAALKKWTGPQLAHGVAWGVCMILILALWVGVVAGAWRVARSAFHPRRVHVAWTAHLMVLLVLGYIIAVSAGPEAYARFRVPLIPFLAAYASIGFVSMRVWFARKSGNR